MICSPSKFRFNINTEMKSDDKDVQMLYLLCSSACYYIKITTDKKARDPITIEAELVFDVGALTGALKGVFTGVALSGVVKGAFIG